MRNELTFCFPDIRLVERRAPRLRLAMKRMRIDGNRVSDMNVARTSSLCARHRFDLQGWRAVSAWLAAVCAAWTIAALVSPAHAEPVTTYRGICNASAGVDIGAGHFVVGDDDIDSLVVYQYGEPGLGHRPFIYSCPENISYAGGSYPCRCFC